MNQRIGYDSTDDQNVDLQRDALSLAGVQCIYEEMVSGKAAGREELEHCLKALRPGDTLVAWRLDRLGRSLPDLVRIVTELEDRTIGLESITEKTETSSATGKLVFHVFAALAGFERNLICGRTQAGLAAARARPGWRSKAEAGYTTNKKVKRLMSDPSIPVNQIAQRYKVSRTTIYKVASRSAAPAIDEQAGARRPELHR